MKRLDATTRPRHCAGGEWLALAVLVFSLTAAKTSGTTYRTPPAVESNLLVFDGKVAFVDGMDGLTVLNFRSGQVILRQRISDELGWARELRKAPTGVLLISNGKVTLADPVTFQRRWTIDNCFSPAVEGPYIVAADGNRTVRCFDATTGERRWSKEIEGGWRVMMSDGVAVVSTEYYYEGQTAFWAFDAKSGRLLTHKTGPEGKKWIDVFCDGEFVYAIAASSKWQNYGDSPDSVIKFDLQDQEVARAEFSSPLVTRLEAYVYPFVFDGRTFVAGERCRKAFPHELKVPAKGTIPSDARSDWLPSGVLTSFEMPDSTGKQGNVVQLMAASKLWSNYVPFVRAGEWLQSADEVDGRILLNWSGGQIECLDSATGTPQWLYVLPSLRRILSYSTTFTGEYARSTDATRAKLFAVGLKYLGESCGSIGMSAGTKPEDLMWTGLTAAARYTAPIVVDPAPDLPFKDLPKRVMQIEIVAGASLVGLAGCLIWFHGQKARRLSEEKGLQTVDVLQNILCVSGSRLLAAWSQRRSRFSGE